MANYIQNINIQVEDYLPEDFNLSANWKNHSIRLNELEDAANKILAAKGRSTFTTGDKLDSFRRSNEVEAFVRSLERRELTSNTVNLSENNNQSRNSNNYFSSPLIISKIGRYGGTWAHPLIALRFAAWLDPDLEVEIYKRFLENKIIEKRVESSDAWNKLRYSYSSMVGDSYRFYHFVHIANAIGEKLECDNWDTADEETLVKRTKIQDTLSFLMDSKVIKNREQVLKTISKMEV